MLIEFMVKNYRSFRDEARLSMEATHLVGMTPEIDARNIFTAPNGRRLLKTAVIYGANASGKSNLIGAMLAFHKILRREPEALGAPLAITPFRLSTATSSEPTTMEATFLLDGREFRFGFRASPTAITEEWLYERPKKVERLLYRRTAAGIDLSRAFSEGEGLQARVRSNTLFLSVVAAFNGKLANLVRDGLVAHLAVVSDIADRDRHGPLLQAVALSTFEVLQHIDGTTPVARALKDADLGIEAFEFATRPATVDDADAQGDTPPRPVLAVHPVRDESGAVVGRATFELDHDESGGTRKFFVLLGIAVPMLQRGSTLVVDELDARLHPLLTRKLVELFYSPETNPKNAQLIFATHDTNLLTPELFRRDQVWFTEKAGDGASDLYSLAEIKGVRENESYERGYLQGRYGAVPILNRFGAGPDVHGKE